MDESLKNMITAQVDSIVKQGKIAFVGDDEKINLEDIFQHCVAMANSGGGNVFIGITPLPEPNVLGTDLYPDENQLAKDILDNTQVNAEVFSMNFGKRIVYIRIAESENPAYQYKYEYYVRDEDKSLKLTKEEFDAFIAKG